MTQPAQPYIAYCLEQEREQDTRYKKYGKGSDRKKKMMGDRVRFARTRLGYSQEQLGTVAGTNQAVVQKIENGKVAHSRAIENLAHTLEVPLWWLLDGAVADDELLLVAFFEACVQKLRRQPW